MRKDWQKGLSRLILAASFVVAILFVVSIVDGNVPFAQTVFNANSADTSIIEKSNSHVSQIFDSTSKSLQNSTSVQRPSRLGRLSNPSSKNQINGVAQGGNQDFLVGNDASEHSEFAQKFNSSVSHNEIVGDWSFSDESWSSQRTGSQGGRAGTQRRTVTLPAANVGEDYCVFLEPPSDAQPNRWRVVSGDIPADISLDEAHGMLCGVARSAGLFVFIVRMFFDAGIDGDILYTLAVAENESVSEGELGIVTTEFPSAIVGKDYTAQLLGTANNLPIVWRIVGLPAELQYDSQNGLVFGTPLTEGVYTVEVYLSDADQEAVSSVLLLEVRSSPVFITTSSISDVFVGEPFYYRLTAQGGTPPYRWQILSGGLPDGIILESDYGVLSGNANQVADKIVRVSVLDTVGDSDAADLQLKVFDGDLTVTTQELPMAVLGANYSVQLQARGGHPPYSWTIVSGSLPSELQLDTAGLLSGEVVANAETSSGDYLINVAVKDSLGVQSQQNMRLIVVQSGLEVFSLILPVGSICVDYSGQLQAKGGTPPYTWFVQSGSLPDGFELSSDGFVTGYSEQSINTSIVATVSDRTGSKSNAATQLIVQDAALKIPGSLTPISGSTGLPFLYQLLVNGGCAPYTWMLISGNLPQGISLFSNGLLEGTVEESGVFSIVVGVTDVREQQTSVQLEIAIASSVLQIETEILPKAQSGESYSESFHAKGGVLPYVFSVVSGNLPEGLVLNPLSGSIDGTLGDAGEYTFHLLVRDDSDEIDERSFTLFVDPGEVSLRALDSAMVSPRVGEHFEQKFLSSGGVAPYTLSVVSGDVPDGMFLSQQALSGVPVQAGTYQLKLQATDARGASGALDYSLRVNPAEIQIISDRVLPSGVVGENYWVELSAIGGEEPYTWTLLAGVLPHGIVFDAQHGLLEGVPEEALESVVLRVQVTEQNGAYATKDLNISVDADGLLSVSDLIVQPSRNCAGLAWRNPAMGGFERTIVVRSDAAFALSIDQGEVVYDGKNTNIVDVGLTSGKTYYYTVFADYGSQGIAAPGNSGSVEVVIQEVGLSESADPFVDEVVVFNPLDPSTCFGSTAMPHVVLGPPQGSGENSGSYDVVSLHSKVNNDGGSSAPYGGSIVLRFRDNIVRNGSGVDFTVFENAFRIGNTTRYFLEPAIVEVSVDGHEFYRFPVDFVSHYDQDGNLDLRNPYCYATGFAGIRPVFSNGITPDPTNPSVSGGDSFDLDSISGANLSWVQFVRITATGDNWLKDNNGDAIRHDNEAPLWSASGTHNSGFDLDAIAAVNY